MTYDALRVTAGREPATLVEFDLDKCTNLYGGGLLSPLDGTCTGAQAAGSECFNSRQTCHDIPNYINSSSVSPQTPLVIQLSDRQIDGQEYIPCIKSTKLTPIEISPGQAFNKRASITITFQDFPHHDRGIDPYVSTRSYTPEDQGTFFGKLLARNPHYQGRPLRLMTGYVDDPFSTGDFKTENYIIEKFWLSKDGVATIVAKDVLKLADDDRAFAPAASTGKLEAVITEALVLTVTSGTEGEYNAESDYVRIGDEIILAPAANRSANVFSNITRGTWNTVATPHAVGDAVQACKYVNGVNVRDLIDDLLVNYANIPSGYIITADWDAEETLWLISAVLTGLLTEPTGIKSLMDELSEQAMVYNWWDAKNQEIKLKAIAPIAARTVELNDADHFTKDPEIMIEQEDRVSRVLLYYNPKTPLAFKEPKDFDLVYGFIDADKESADQYNDVRVKNIFSRWITTDALAIQTGSRTKNQFQNPPKFITFIVDAKDATNVVGDYIDINTRAIQDEDGSNKITAVQILKVEEITMKVPGTFYKMTCQETQFSGRYGRIVATTSPMLTYATATDAQKESGSFIAPTGDEKFTSDNGEAYKIA